MERKLGRLPVLIAAVLAAAASFGLRLHQLKNAYEIAADGEKRIIPGAASGFFTWFTVIMVVVFCIYACSLKKRKKFSALGGLSLPELVLSGAAVLLLLLGSVAMIASPENPNSKVELLLGIGGLAAAFCWIGTALLRYRGSRPHVGLYLLPVLFFAAMLIVEFRIWSRDPAILDYCYDLFALISVMLGLFYVGSFSLDRGRRRMAVFFLLCGLFFCAASIAGSRLRHCCIMGGTMLWMLLHLWRLLRPGRRQEQTEEAAEETT